MAALSIAIAEAQKKRATRENRELQLRAELRLEELIKVGGIADHYERVNRRGHLEVETAFARVLHLVDTEAEKRAVVAAYMAWAEPVCSYCARPTDGDYRLISIAHTTSIACGVCTGKWEERYADEVES